MFIYVLETYMCLCLLPFTTNMYVMSIEDSKFKRKKGLILFIFSFDLQILPLFYKNAISKSIILLS
jgi:hypothetical protein